jgi:hypothetical protein
MLAKPLGPGILVPLYFSNSLRPSFLSSNYFQNFENLFYRTLEFFPHLSDLHFNATATSYLTLEGCRNAAEKRFDFFETWHENFAEKLAK